MVKCICGPNLEIVSSICGDLSSGQTQNGVNFDFHVKFDLEGQGRSLHKTIGILTKVFYTFAPNLVILAQTVDELSCGQTHDWRTHTHRHTHAGNDNTRRPKLASGKNENISLSFLKSTAHNRGQLDELMSCWHLKWIFELERRSKSQDMGNGIAYLGLELNFQYNFRYNLKFAAILKNFRYFR